MEERIYQAALAGLLHDIGKVARRSTNTLWNPPGDAAGNGQSVDAAWTIEFIRRCVPERYQPAALAGGNHLDPEKSPTEFIQLSRLVALADLLSAGELVDREEKRSRPQLLSIFDRIDTNQNKSAVINVHYLPLHALQLSREVIFPDELILNDDQAGESYDDLRSNLERELGEPIDDPQLYIENILGGLQRATWCVPSAYYHSIPDVSLYDHSRMTAALAVCLADKPDDEIKAMTDAIQRDYAGQKVDADQQLLDEPVTLLIGGDISGIQKFIYTISSRKAAKTLRGRSFYLQLLTEAVLRYVLKELGLPYTNVIYSGGGHFFLLAPLSAKEKLPGIRVLS